MNYIKFILSFLVIITVYSAYDDCENTEYKYKYTQWDFLTSKYETTESPDNKTFIATSVDDCKDRSLLKKEPNYDDNGDSHDEEYYYEHCCFLTYDNMEKYEYKEIGRTRDDKGNIKRDYEKITGKCIALTDVQYKNIKEFILSKQFLQSGGYMYNNLKIDCKSYNIHFFMISLALLFLF